MVCSLGNWSAPLHIGLIEEPGPIHLPHAEAALPLHSLFPKEITAHDSVNDAQATHELCGDKPHGRTEFILLGTNPVP